MAKLQCNVCGGALSMRADGNSVCENCGMVYKPEIVKQMAAEITGTVKIDGEVKVAGISTVDKLAQNGETFIKLGEPDKAKEVYQKMIKEYPEDYRGWWGSVVIATNSFTGGRWVSWSDAHTPCIDYINEELVPYGHTS
jgi:hypothetical protein